IWGDSSRRHDPGLLQRGRAAGRGFGVLSANAITAATTSTSTAAASTSTAGMSGAGTAHAIEVAEQRASAQSFQSAPAWLGSDRPRLRAGPMLFQKRWC